MKILVDARFYGLEHTGIGRYVMNLIDQFAKTDNVNEYSILLRKKYFDELKLPSNFKKIQANFSHYGFFEQVKLPLLVRKIKPDITHFPHFNVPVVLGGKFVVTVHDLLMHSQKGKKATTLPFFAYFTKRLGYKTVFRRAIKGSSAIIVPSETVKNEIVDYYKIDQKKISIIYEGVSDLSKKSVSDPAKILQEYGLNEPYFVYAGNAYPHKNLERAIRAIIRLNQHSKVVFAIISARNIFVERLGKIISENNAKHCVKLLGYVPDEELSVLYKNSLGFLYPSLTEGFGLPGLEAIKAGTISLVSDIPVFREVYKDNALYFDPLKIESILYTLEKAVKMEQKERNNFIKMSQKYIQKFSWSKMAKETMSVYNRTVHNESSHSLRPNK